MLELLYSLRVFNFNPRRRRVAGRADNLAGDVLPAWSYPIKRTSAGQAAEWF